MGDEDKIIICLEKNHRKICCELLDGEFVAMVELVNSKCGMGNEDIKKCAGKLWQMYKDLQRELL